MVAPTKINLKVYQGSTFSQVVRWESSVKGYSPITGITKAAPMEVTSVGHTIPPGWRVQISGVQGMKEINSDEYLVVTGTTVNLLSFNAVNSTTYSTYTSGGTIAYNLPNSLAGLTARMQVREKITSTTTLLELTTENGGILLDDTLKTITIFITATASAELTFKSGVYSLEIIDGTRVIPLLVGNVSLVNEVTR